MKLIVGLGNPGKEYQSNRHNIGFSLVDLLGRRWAIELKKRRHHGLCGAGVQGRESVVLLKPQTFMNNSGSSVAEAVNFYKLVLDDLLVVVDDMALPTGQLRLRRGGSAGGHNGLKDIQEKLGTQDFSRMRIGIGPAGAVDAISHVLGDFAPPERLIIEQALKTSADAVECWINLGIDEAMTRYNRTEGRESEANKSEKEKPEV